MLRVLYRKAAQHGAGRPADGYMRRLRTKQLMVFVLAGIGRSAAITGRILNLNIAAHGSSQVRRKAVLDVRGGLGPVGVAFCSGLSVRILEIEMDFESGRAER
jgi:hypothetical protein